MPIDHVLCGDFTYTSTFITDTGTVAITDLEPFSDVMNDAIGYDPATLTHSVYSENFDLIGTRQYTVTAAFTEYGSVSATSSANIEFMNPCPAPESVLSVDQTNPADYYYTSKAPKM